MKRAAFLSVVLMTALLVSAPAACALGFGFYGSAGTGSADWEQAFAFDGFSTDTSHKSFGMTFDTGLSTDRFFNYHIEIGREWFTGRSFVPRDTAGTVSGRPGDLDLDGVVVSHTFGFGGELSESVRIWFGPEIRWYADVSGASQYEPRFKVKGSGAGIGPSIGVNFNFNSGLTMMLKTGYLMSNYDFDAEGYINGQYISTDYDVEEYLLYVNLEILFRSPGDR